MAQMWECSYCEEKVGPGARSCTHCGGAFGITERAQMRTRARRKAEASGDTVNEGCLGVLLGGIAFGLLSIFDYVA